MAAKTFIAAVASTLAATAVLAQTPPEPGAAQPSGIELQLPVRPNLSPQEMVSTGQDYLQKMTAILKRLQTLREKARKEKDIIRLNCVTDKLVQAKVSTNIAEQSMSALQEAIAGRDDASRIHEFSRLTLVHQKVQVLMSEAEACTGEDILIPGPSRVDTEVDPSIPPHDPTQPEPPSTGTERPPERPPEASPFR